MRTPFKTILISALATFSAFISIAYFSCNRDKCKTIVCANGGICNGGACICPTGYEGSNCETISVQNFTGNWQVTEKGSTTAATKYPVTIAADTGISNVLISNFYNFFITPIRGYVIADTLYIPNQQLQGKVIIGKGVISSNLTYGQYGLLTMTYEVVDTATNTLTDFGWYPTDGSSPSLWTK